MRQTLYENLEFARAGALRQLTSKLEALLYSPFSLPSIIYCALRAYQNGLLFGDLQRFVVEDIVDSKLLWSGNLKLYSERSVRP